jgi:hypothetical protein
MATVVVFLCGRVRAGAVLGEGLKIILQSKSALLKNNPKFWPTKKE